MGLRFQRRVKLFPGLWLNFSKSGVSASAGVSGFTVNSRGTATAGLPGTGISYRQNLSTSQRRQQQRPTQTGTEAVIQELLSALLETGDALWRQGLVDRVLEYPDTPRKVREAAYSIRSIEACELHCRRARGPVATRRAALDVINAVQIVLAFTEEQGWSQPAQENN